MFNIKEIFKASVCSFCENIYEYNSIDEGDFIKSFKYFLTFILSHLTSILIIH